MDRLWTPWRLAYVTDASTHVPDCIFCDAERAHDPLVVHETRLSFVILNRYPYNNGHLMVVPRRHVGWLADLTPEELSDFIVLTRDGERALQTAYAPHGFNMGLNLGKPAGAGVLGHLHMHIVPRWSGDTNFMSVTGETRVLPEELPETARRVRAAFQESAR